MLQKELLEFFISLGPFGFLICLGVRKTTGSQEMVLPSERNKLLDGFNKLHTVLSEEE